MSLLWTSITGARPGDLCLVSTRSSHLQLPPRTTASEKRCRSSERPQRAHPRHHGSGLAWPEGNGSSGASWTGELPFIHTV